MLFQNNWYIYYEIVRNYLTHSLNSLLLSQHTKFFFCMKKIIAAAGFCIAAVTGFSQTANTFTLNGKITGMETGKLRMTYYNGKLVHDSAEIKNGIFSFKGAVTGPVEAYFSGNTKSNSMDDPDYTSFFIEPGNITISLTEGNFKNAVITGSKTQDEAKVLSDSLEPLRKTIQPLQDEFTRLNNIYIQAKKDKRPEKELDSLHEVANAAREKIGDFQPQQQAITYRFFAAYPSSYVTVTNLRNYISSLPLDSIKMFFNRMNSQVQHSVYGQQIAKEIEQMQAGSPGSTATNFTADDITGKPLSLTDFKGKYVLVDFWASWCIPCRHSNPHLKELYAKYHDKGFDIIGVSDDDGNDTAWRKAVAHDGIDIWHHVLRGMDIKKIQKGEANDKDISDKYGIHSLPTKILIDKDGVIVGRYDKGTEEEQAEMDKKIAEAMGS